MKPRPSAHPPTLAYRLHGNCYLNITSHCTLRCAFCPKFNKTWTVQDHNLYLASPHSADEVLAAIGDMDADKEVVFCGLGEPTLNLPVLLDVARALKTQGKRIRLNTDGLANRIYNRDITAELAKVVDAVSISLNAQDEATYNRHCRPKITGAYEALQTFASSAKQQGMDVTLTALDGLDGVDISACKAIADHLGVKFRRRVLGLVG